MLRLTPAARRFMGTVTSVAITICDTCHTCQLLFRVAWLAGRIEDTARQERGQPCPRELDLKPGTRGHGCPRSNLESALPGRNVAHGLPVGPVPVDQQPVSLLLHRPEVDDKHIVEHRAGELAE